MRTCEILLAYASNERENETLPVFVDITYLHFFRCIQLYWTIGVNFLGQNGEQTKTDIIGLFPGNFQLNYGRITFRKLVQPILPTDFHFTNGTSFAIQCLMRKLREMHNALLFFNRYYLPEFHIMWWISALCLAILCTANAFLPL